MKAIILAAGPGSRLRPLTNSLPKCMLPIKGKPILQNILDLFRANGVADITVVTGHQGDKITDPNISRVVNRDYLNNNILHSMMCARAKLEEARQGDPVGLSRGPVEPVGEAQEALEGPIAEEQG